MKLLRTVCACALLIPLLAACGEVDPVKAKNDQDSSFFHCAPGNGAQGNCYEH